MTKLLVFSDTHGDVSAVTRVIQQYPEASYVLHLGDFARDIAVLESRHPDRIVLGVAGNCDSGADPSKYPAERILEIEGCRILMTHGNRLGVRFGLFKLYEYAKSKKVQVVLFGHTHKSFKEFTFGIKLLNPGSLPHPRGLEIGPSFGFVEVNNGRADVHIMDGSMDWY